MLTFIEKKTMDNFISSNNSLLRNILVAAKGGINETEKALIVDIERNKNAKTPKRDVAALFEYADAQAKGAAAAIKEADAFKAKYELACPGASLACSSFDTAFFDGMIAKQKEAAARLKLSTAEREIATALK